MKNKRKHHTLDKKFAERIEELLYSKTDEKKILRELLEKIFSERKFKHVLDVGAGPGLLTDVFAKRAAKLTIVEALSGYSDELFRKYPNANIIVDSIENVSLSREYDLILLSHVLYYVPQKDWVPLVSKLLAALLQGGELVIIMLSDSGDWWHIIENYKERLGKYSRFDYIPLSKFKSELSNFGTINSYPFSFTWKSASKEDLIAYIAQEALLINDKDILRNYHSDFEKFVARFQGADCKYELRLHAEIVILKISK